MDILNYLATIEFTTPLLITKIIFIIFILFFFGFIIFALVRTFWLRRLILWDLQEFFTFRPYGVKKIEKQWLKIKVRLDTGLEGEYKLAVIEADLMLDDILKKMGYTGETLGERLGKLTAVSLPNLEVVKEVHQSRNNIVHDPDYRLPLDEARRIIEVYEKALTDLQAL
jgi:hypothetical protein